MEEREDLKERMDLAVERIHQIAANPEVEGPAGDYFKRTAQFMELVLEKKDWKHASLAELQKWNRELYEDIEGEAYEKSFANPSYAVQMLGEGVGQILSFIYTEIRGMIVYAFEGREEELLIHMEPVSYTHLVILSGLQEHWIREATKYIRLPVRSLMRRQDIICGGSGPDFPRPGI